jgi:hypothetical protein
MVASSELIKQGCGIMKRKEGGRSQCPGGTERPGFIQMLLLCPGGTERPGFIQMYSSAFAVATCVK